MHAETGQNKKERKTAIQGHQKYEGNIDKKLRRKATVMNMATVRNLMVISDKSE
jgi:hypothetical protein